jgi:Zn-dependent peptidase ImmA (M78 family)/transcriptional regulator with XRE-family HTH domain
MTKRQLAELIGVSAAAVGQYESGTRPRPDLITAIAAQLGYPVEFFKVGRPHAKLDASTAHFRSLRSTRSFQRAKAISFTEQVWELTYALEKKVQLPWIDLPGFGRESSSPGLPADVARSLRARWQLGTGPIPHLIRTLEMHGVVVTLAPPADGDFSTVSAFSTSHLPRPIIVISRDRADDVYRHRFTAAHELGHLVLHTDVRSGDTAQEREADAFAAEFLTPRASILPGLPARLNFAALGDLRHIWGVSIDSLIYRCHEVGRFSDVTTARGYKRLHALRGEGSFAPEPIGGYPGEQPTLLRSGFDLASRCGLTLPSLADELAWPIDRVREVLGTRDHRPALRLVPGGSVAP